jgi:hypothetical protein
LQQLPVQTLTSSDVGVGVEAI